MSKFLKYLSGTDLRSVGKSNLLSQQIRNQEDFDELFSSIINTDRVVAMRAIDAAEKVSRNYPEYLKIHVPQILELLRTARHKEVKWHLAQLVSRIPLSSKELSMVWEILYAWVMDTKESRIVRVESLQCLYQLSRIASTSKIYKEEFDIIRNSIAAENIPSLNARMRKMK